jgi:hypothetical protein
MTLMELLLALAATAFIGAAIAAMFVAVAYGSSSSDELRTLAVRSKAINNRLGAAIRGSKLILDQGDDYLVLWTRDLNEDDQPSLLEIRRIERDDATDELINYQADPSATDVAYDLADDFDAITTALIGDPDFPDELWARSVTAWQMTLNGADPQSSTLIAYRITLAADQMSETAINTVTLRSQ